MTFETLGVSCDSGAKAKGEYPLGELSDGSSVSLPVRIVHGVADGSVLCLTGAIHGDEPNALAAINRLCDELDPENLSGVVVGFPLANPLAFITKSRVSPLDSDSLNLNRVFPGNAQGLITERIAAAIFEGGIRRASFLIDLHSGGYEFCPRYLVAHRLADDPKLSAENLRLARAFGMGIPIHLLEITTYGSALGGLTYPHGLATAHANEVGVPALVCEIGGGGGIRSQDVDATVEGMYRVMREVGMLKGGPAGTELAQHVANENRTPRPRHGGWWEPTVELGQVIEAGRTLGRVRNMFGEVIEEVRSPERVVVFDVRRAGAIMTGERTVNCGVLAAG